MNAQKNKKTESQNKELRYKQLQDFAIEVNWKQLIQLIVHHYVDSGIGRLQVPVETMIRIYFLQLRYNLNAPEAALALSRIDVLTEFSLIDKRTDVLPEAETIDMFRSLIELKGLAEQFGTEFNIQPIIKQVAKQA